MPKLERVLETVLYVADLDRADRFYRDLFDLPCLFADARLRAFDVNRQGVLLLFPAGQSLAPIPLPGGTIPPHDGSGPVHIAFAIGRDDLAAWERHLADRGVTVESRVDWPRGGVSLYFRDPDAHLLELATPGLWPGY